MDKLVRRLETWIRTNHPELRSELKKGMMAKRLVKMEEESGADLSEDFRALLRWRNGTKPNPTQDFCPEGMLLGEDGIHETWSKWMELEYNGRFPTGDWFHPSWVPFVGGNGKFLCVDSTGTYNGVPGQVVEFNPDGPMRRVMAESLGKWLETMVSALEQGLLVQEDGRYHIVDERIEEYVGLVSAINPGYPVEVEAGAEAKPAFHRLLDAIRDKEVDVARDILENEADEIALDRTGPDGRPPLVSAAISGSAPMVALILEKGASVDWQDWTDGRRALHWACEYGPDTVPLLIEAGSDVNHLLNYSALTPLMLAAWAGHASSVQLLLDAGANPSRKSSLGETAMSKTEDEDTQDVLRVALAALSAASK